jgi:hypothetical protein
MCLKPSHHAHEQSKLRTADQFESNCNVLNFLGESGESNCGVDRNSDKQSFHVPRRSRQNPKLYLKAKSVHLSTFVQCLSFNSKYFIGAYFEPLPNHTDSHTHIQL